MQIPRQMINAIGAIVVVAIVAAGVLMAALPQYGESTRVSAEATRVAGDNAVYQGQVEGLRAEEARFDEISTELDALREEIPTSTQLDDVIEIVAAAAEETGVTIVSVTSSAPVPWVARTAPYDPDADVEAQAAEPAPTEPAQEDAAASEAEGTGDAADAAEPAPAADEVPVASPEQSVLVTISVQSGDVAALTAFLDALAEGPRLVSVVRSELTPASTDEPATLLVNALTFTRAES